MKICSAGKHFPDEHRLFNQNPCENFYFKGTQTEASGLGKTFRSPKPALKKTMLHH
jgi:hypothetical protein